MRRATLPISALPAWCKLNDVTFLDTTVKDLGQKGFGLVTERALSSGDTFDIPTLLLVPHDLVLSAEAIEEHGKVDHHFRQLLDAAGGKSIRGDVLLFLLLQITIASPDQSQNVGLSNPWTEYVKMLPSEVPTPTMWSEEERVMLVGTSLETALSAKMATLLREFEALREKTSEIAWCHKCWWEQETLTFSDWVLLDALYRSRCLELPNPGECLVPGLDLANHSSQANAFYEPNSTNGVALVLKPDFKLEAGVEVTISYGSSKSEAEMLFSYGFIDSESVMKVVVLNSEPFPDDPLGKAKVSAFTGPPIIRISETEAGVIQWESPFLYLLCLNEEDGLEFRVLQETDGSRSPLRVFWQGADVTEMTGTFESLISSHELKDVFRLRTVAILQDKIRQQIERLYESEETVLSLIDLSLVAWDRQSAAIQLRNSEAAILETAFASIDDQKNKLLENEIVIRYLASMAAPDEEPPAITQDQTTDDEDFS